MGNSLQSPRGSHYGYSSMANAECSPVHHVMDAGQRSAMHSSESRCGAMCCQSGGRKMEQYKSREEALAKARFYRDRNFDLALHAYSAALDFPRTSGGSPSSPNEAGHVLHLVGLPMSAELQGDRSRQSVNGAAGCPPGTFFMTPRGVGVGCFDACQDSTAVSDTCQEGGSPSEQRPAGGSSSAASTAFTSSGDVSRLASEEDINDMSLGGQSKKRGAQFSTSVPPAAAAFKGRFFQSSSSSLALTVPPPPSSSTQGGAGSIPGSDEDERKRDDALCAKICDEIAQLYLTHGDKEEALRYYNKATNLAPHIVVFIYRRGVVLQLLGQEDAAIQAFRRALQVEPHYKAALFNLGTCLMRRESGREEALRIFQKLMVLEPADHQVLSLVAHCYEMDGRYEEALAYRQRVVQLDPQNFRAKRELTQLKQQILKENGDELGTARLRRAGTVI
ncbi:tpr domain-containing [Cystoisospora suis]|uniref:Tpr domain-containing n=1 Tax=Cystoisospora suis TaxID=483139 RepID=A0A2C6JUI5_9APIC|nr:tpr domain-containing [Cystoisospora suis]